MEDNQLVSNSSKAYGYNYASLGDIALQGFKIPEMRIKPTEFGEFVEYKDANGEWQTGARVVIPAMKGSNEAQCYGSALTYARRYTTLMAHGLACDDDKKLEKAEPVKQAAKKSVTIPEQVTKFNEWIRNNPSKRMEVHQWCNEQFGEGYALTSEVATAALNQFDN